MRNFGFEKTKRHMEIKQTITEYIIQTSYMVKNMNVKMDEHLSRQSKQEISLIENILQKTNIWINKNKQVWKLESGEYEYIPEKKQKETNV